VEKMCEVLSIKRSSYYSWVKRPECKRKKNDKELVEHIRRIHKESRETYGARRVKAQLNKENIYCGKDKVSRLMNENNIFSRLKRKFKATTYSNHKYPVAPNLLNQDFKADKPNTKWVGDITYISTDEGWLYLASIEDLFQKEVVGWSLDTRMTRKLVMSAMEQAINKHNPEPGLIFHSDRGVQYASYDYQEQLRKNQIKQSMSRKGNCFDNACGESFFASLKKDVIYGRKFKTIAEAKLEIVDYIETFYNCKRLHSSLGYKSPKEYVKDYYKNKEVA
jgi:putative transposase